MEVLKKLENPDIPSEDLILVDWLTFTSTAWPVLMLQEQMGLADQSWDVLDHGFHGYRSAIVFNGVTIMYDGHKEDMGVCVEISGQGCRALETYGHIDWPVFFEFLMADVNEFHITRLDLAFDDHSGILDKVRLKLDTDDHFYRSRSRTWEVRYGSKGFSIYHGSRQSDIMIRIYDKAAERGLFDGTHWIRVEMQLRDDNASGAIKAYCNIQDLGQVFGGLLANYLSYLEESEDSNISRWPVADYWSKLIAGAEAIHIAASPGVDYNIFHLESWLINTAGGGLKTWIEIYGLDALPEMLKRHKGKLNPKHKHLLDQFHSMQHKTSD